MAFKEYKDYNHEHAADEFRNGTFNVTQAVGKSEHGTGFSAANCITDMQLVYYFLYVICRYGDRTIFPVSSPAVFSNVKIQPRYQNYHSEETKNKLGERIRIFQQNLRDAGRVIYIDGRCDKARSTFSSISNTGYTIHYANYHYAKTIKSWQNRTDWQDFLLRDPMLPEEARAELIMSSSFGSVQV